jgi:hypothetical protein
MGAVWPNRDPIQERGGVNLYRSMRNNLLKYIDTCGLQIVIEPDFPSWGEGGGPSGVYRPTVNDPYDLSDIYNEWNHLNFENPQDFQYNPSKPIDTFEVCMYATPPAPPRL